MVCRRGYCGYLQDCYPLLRREGLLGASAVVIADNMCLCSDTDCDFKTNSCQPSPPLLTGDGSEGDISIPTFLLFKTGADAIKAHLRQGSTSLPVQMELAWSLPPLQEDNDGTSPPPVVAYELWTTPANPFTMEFMGTFKQVALALGSRAFFTPHMVAYRISSSLHRGRNRVLA